MARIISADRRCLPYAEWPEGDRELWLRAFDRGDLLDDAGLAAGWSRQTTRTVEAAYGRWLSFLIETGRMIAGHLPADRLSKDNLRAYVACLQKQVSSITVRNRIRDLCEAVRVMGPGSDLMVVRALMRRLWYEAKPSRVKQSHIVPAQRLYELGLELMARAEHEKVRNRPWQATRYRNGLIIALLSRRPLRRGELLCLTIGHHIQIVHETVTIILGPRDTKSRKPIAYPWPEEIRPHLFTYLNCYRPALLGHRRSQHLWITHCGESLTEDGFYGQLHAVVTSSVLQDPGLLPHASALLGHADTAITIQHYNHAPAQDAYRRYQCVLQSMLEPE